MKTKIVILLVLIVFSACKPHNKLKTNEQKLTTQIIQDKEEEEKERLKKDRKKKVSTSSKIKAFRLEEDRSLDLNHPPVVLNIPEARKKIKPVRFSELGKSIRYVYLIHPNDSTFFQHSTRILITKNNIIATTLRGIARFDMQGQFIEMICVNGQKYIFDEKLGKYYSNSELMSQYTGSVGTVSAIGDKIIFKYVNNLNYEGYIVEYNASPGKQTLMMSEKGEKDGLKCKGKILAFISFSEGYPKEEVILLDENHLLTMQSKFQSNKKGVFMTTQSLNGDTVCTFNDHDPLVNFTGSAYRGVEDGDIYRLNGKQYLRQKFNDTIYRFEGINRLVPEYVIDLGKKGIKSSKEAINPKFSLKDKFVSNKIVDTKNFLFYLYTQDYACPNTARNGTLKYNLFVLNKKTREQFHGYVDADPLLPDKKMTWPIPPQTNIINDLDFGQALWPKQKTESGQIFFQILGKQLKEHLKENQRSIVNTNREKLKMLAEICANNDMIIMIIE